MGPQSVQSVPSSHLPAWRSSWQKPSFVTFLPSSMQVSSQRIGGGRRRARRHRRQRRRRRRRRRHRRQRRRGAFRQRHRGAGEEEVAAAAAAERLRHLEGHRPRRDVAEGELDRPRALLGVERLRVVDVGAARLLRRADGGGDGVGHDVELRVEVDRVGRVRRRRHHRLLALRRPRALVEVEEREVEARRGDGRVGARRHQREAQRNRRPRRHVDLAEALGERVRRRRQRRVLRRVRDDQVDVAAVGGLAHLPDPERLLLRRQPASPRRCRRGWTRRPTPCRRRGRSGRGCPPPGGTRGEGSRRRCGPPPRRTRTPPATAAAAAAPAPPL